MPDEVQIAWPGQRSMPRPHPTLRRYGKSGFPSRILTEAVIVQTLRELAGSVKIRDAKAGWNIYDELAARLGVSIDSRTRLMAGTEQPAWWTEVGLARKNLELRGIIEPTSESGPEVWALAASAQAK